MVNPGASSNREGCKLDLNLCYVQNARNPKIRTSHDFIRLHWRDERHRLTRSGTTTASSRDNWGLSQDDASPRVSSPTSEQLESLRQLYRPTRDVGSYTRTDRAFSCRAGDECASDRSDCRRITTVPSGLEARELLDELHLWGGLCWLPTWAARLVASIQSRVAVGHKCARMVRTPGPNSATGTWSAASSTKSWTPASRDTPSTTGPEARRS